MLETQKQSHTVRNTVCGHYWVRMRPREKELRTKKKHIINFQRFLCTYAINFEPSVICLLDNERIAVVRNVPVLVSKTNKFFADSIESPVDELHVQFVIEEYKCSKIDLILIGRSRSASN